MARFVLRRLLIAIPTILGVATLTFFLLKLAPGDPALTFLGNRATPEMVAHLREATGLDKPVWDQYLSFLGGLFTGNLGQSFTYQTSVVQIIGTRLPPTLWLMLVSVLLAVIISVPLGLIAALSKNNVVAVVIRGFIAIIQGVPTFFLGMVLIIVFALTANLFPVGGYGDSPIEHAQSLFLPGLTVALMLAPILIRSLVASMSEALASPSVEFATAKGLRRRTVVYQYAFRNSAVAGVTVLGIQIGTLVGGVLVVENVFGIPGLGTLLLQSVLTRDFPVVQGLTLVFGVMVVLIYLGTDVLYSALDPRVALKGRS